MKWEQALKLLRLASRPGRERFEGGPEPAGGDRSPYTPRASSICVASGKGGTGKSITTASLGALFARQGRTLIVDADMGVGNAHILQNVSPAHSFVDVVEGRLGVSEVVTHCDARLDLLPAGSGVSHMASLSSYELQMVATGLSSLEEDYEYVIVDSAAGISNQTMAFAAACDLVLIVTTPDLTAMTDAYAFLKVLSQRQPDVQPLMLVNRARSMAEAERVAERMCSVSRKFLDIEPRWVGTLPDDVAVLDSVNSRSPVVTFDPNSPAAQSLRPLAITLLQELAKVRREGVGQTLVERVGFSAGLA